MLVGMALSALSALMVGPEATDRWTSRPDLLRGMQAVAYLAPEICRGDGEIALHIANVSRFHSLTPDVDVAMVEYSIIGLRDDGAYVTFPEDQHRVLESNLAVGMDTIRCVRSEARAQGIGSFVIGLEAVGFPIRPRSPQ